ncbi:MULTISPECIES: hypothetical protein [Serratia]|uniref:hypothetical protein n=1 Tax=Serratia TaxID=613 RepID=UPI0012B5058C|nr:MULTISPECIES: hypothetical protein [Serratia]QPJ87814.1 hypothetical protein HS042_05550 [Serratia marcescens]
MPYSPSCSINRYRHAFAILPPLSLPPRRDVFRNINVIYFKAGFIARLSFYGDVARFSG